MPNQPWLYIAKASEADERKRLEALTARLERGMQRTFLDAVDRLGERIDVREIIRLLRENRVSEAIAIVSEAMVRASLSPIAAMITEGVWTAGRAAVVAMREIRSFSNIEIVFRQTNPRTSEFLQRYEMGLIREMTDEALSNVRRVITEGVNEGRNPRDIARDVRGHIGLTRQQSQYVRNYRRNLEELDGRALGRALRDRRSDGPVRRAIDSAQPLKPEKINSLVQAYERRWLKHRAETIARTEAIRSLNIGNQEAWSQAAESGQFPESKIVRKWVATHDGRTRDSHRAIPKMNEKGVGLREPFLSPEGPIMYPGDPAAPASMTVGCRCTVILRYQPSRGEA
mgnify:CR=1 FL=1